MAPTDISIPHGIFREGTEVALHQIKLSDIALDARGVVVVQASEAAPYLKMTKPMSSKGLALIVLDHTHELMTGVGEDVRFPALCTHTSEPMLLTAKLVQIGSIAVSRNHAPAAPKIEVVDNAVIRVVTFKDEWTLCPWSEFVQSPVKHLIKCTPMLQTPEVILDCWDRQWMTLKMSKIKPADCEVFVASFRLAGTQFDDMLAGSGENGCYYEPRSIDGRQHAQDFKVVWLNKTDRLTAAAASQSTKAWTSLVRAGLRFGLRCRLIDAEQVHDQRKPNQPFLEGNLLGFHVGPFPFGATRLTIGKAFKTWNWPAKPSQPKGRSADGQGVIWEVYATQMPPFHVFSMEHSDILISPMPEKAKANLQPPAVQGSAKTIAALRATQTDVQQTDPWLNKQGPWSEYTPSKQRKQAHGTPHQVDVLATQIERKVLKAVHDQVATVQADSSMTDDTRLTELESRMSALEHNMTVHQQQQQQHNNEVAAQMTGVQGFFDRKLNEQMGRIEALLTAKRE